MDPYAILEIPQGISEADLKKAFRKKAMKWHPDRVGSSAEAKEKFYEINHAYKTLVRELREQTKQAQFNTRENQRKDEPKAGKDGVFLNEMLEYAIKLAESGYTRKGIKIKIRQKGADEKIADSVSEQAISYLNNAADSRGSDRSAEENLNKYRTRKFDYSSVAAVLGQHNPGRASMRKISYYLNVFNDLYSEIEAGAIIPMSKNSYLSKVFNRSILLFFILAASIFFLPVIGRLVPLGLVDFFQLPHVILSLVLIWSMYRKLWLLSVIGIVVMAVTQKYFYHTMPISLEQSYRSVLLTAFISYLPFILFTRGSNVFFYLKSKNIIEAAQKYSSDPEDQLIVIRNNGGVSRLSALFMSLLLMFYFLYMIPQDGSLYHKLNWLFPSTDQSVNKDFRQIQAISSQSELLFNTAEAHFLSRPPDYVQARLNYIGAANYGSLLSCYKAGYMYLTGLGGEQNDDRAFKYFFLATQSPLSKQPHKLSKVTRWLAESYNALGVMYLSGYGTARDSVKASEMFSLASKYGYQGAAKTLMVSKSVPHSDLRSRITFPEFE